MADRPNVIVFITDDQGYGDLSCMAAPPEGADFRTPLPPRDLYWEMAGQTAVRRGRWKLVLDGQLVEHDEPVAPLRLADLDADPGERTNLAAAHPDLALDLRDAALAWRAGIEARWTSHWSPRLQGVTTHSLCGVADHA